MSETKKTPTTLYLIRYSHIKNGDQVGLSQIAIMANSESEAQTLAIQRAEARGHKNIRLGPAKVY